MQISTSKPDSKILIPGEVLMPMSKPNQTLKHKILSIFVILLLSCSFLVASVYSFIALDGVASTAKFTNRLLATFSGESITATPTEEPPRQYNNETLSYFSSTELAKLGILALPENYQIQDEYKGIKFVRSPKQSFGQDQLGLLKIFIDRLPARLLNPGPTAIVTYKAGEIKQGTNFNTSTAAFASGTYIFFNDNSFKPEQPLADDSVDAAFNTFVHETGHVDQFNSVTEKLTSRMIESSYQAGLSWIDLILISSRTEKFASIAGWEKVSSGDETTFKLIDPEKTKTTSYGKTKIYEDMAETIAGAVSTNFYQFSDERINWALEYLGETKASLSINKFPTSDTLNAVNATSLQYDVTKEEAFKAKYSYVDKQVFIDETLNSLDTEKTFLNTELILRGWTGTFVRSADKNNVVRYKGEFVGKDRNVYLEMVSYDKATGYIVKPKGTIMVVISGYLQIAN